MPNLLCMVILRFAPLQPVTCSNLWKIILHNQLYTERPDKSLRVILYFLPSMPEDLEGKPVMAF